MKNRLLSFSYITTAFILLLAATLKFSMLRNGHAEGNLFNNPGIPMKAILPFIIAIEAAIGLYTLLSESSARASLHIALATVFLAYRGINYYYGFDQPCQCLGRLNEILGVKTLHLSWVALLVYLASTALIVRLERRVPAAGQKLAAS